MEAEVGRAGSGAIQGFPSPVIGSIRNQRGATLMIVLVMVVVVGLMSGLAGTTWKTVTQREREEQLLWVGNQYVRAIEGYYTRAHAGTQAIYPAALEELVKDPRSLQTLRHIRRLYRDPVTGGDFELIRHPDGRIRGVRSASLQEPFKKDGFPRGYGNFRNAGSYREWAFEFQPRTRGASRPPLNTTTTEQGKAPPGKPPGN